MTRKAHSGQQSTDTEAWLAALVNEVRDLDRPLLPVIAAFQDHIEGNAHAFMLVNAMFEQLSAKHSFSDDPSGEPQVRDYKTMLKLLNAVINRAPAYNRTGVVGVPINAILDRPMGTPAGYAAFIDQDINVHLRAILNEWGRYLRSPDSCEVLNDDPQSGWFGKDARHDMPDFVEEFECDPKAPHHGFASWDRFFTRAFRPGIRPVAAPLDPRVIVNACEAAPFRISSGVKQRDRFWIKEQPYSVEHILAGDPFLSRFVGGTIYQAYLSALSYHRWHSPVDGRVVKTLLVPGTYYSEPLAEAGDASAPLLSQAYISAMATRAIIFIEADDRAIGLMAFVAIGMAEVSTCEITVYDGQRLEKGMETGMFHYGGSSYCLLFGPDVRLTFDLNGQTPGPDSKGLHVLSQLARVE